MAKLKYEKKDLQQVEDILIFNSHLCHYVLIPISLLAYGEDQCQCGMPYMKIVLQTWTYTGHVINSLLESQCIFEHREFTRASPRISLSVSHTAAFADGNGQISYLQLKKTTERTKTKNLRSLAHRIPHNVNTLRNKFSRETHGSIIISFLIITNFSAVPSGLPLLFAHQWSIKGFVLCLTSF